MRDPKGQRTRSDCPFCDSPLLPGATRCGTCGRSTAAPSLNEQVTAEALAPRPPVVVLNPAQKAAVETDGHCVVTAGPGSGKTAVMRERAIRKLRRSRLARGIAVTFTRDAAKELEERIIKAYPDSAGRMVFGTFHSLCKRQLEDAGIAVNIVSEMQRIDLIKRALFDIEGHAPRLSLEKAIRLVDLKKSTVHPDLQDPTICIESGIFLRYQELLRQIGRMDFADMLVMATQKMATGQVKPLPGEFLLVDESQDTDPVQMGWIYAHLDKGVEVCIVGDDDQSIYSFREAQGYRSMEAFRARARATHINLDTSYRCAREILSPAGVLIEHNTERIPKQLRTQNPNRGRVIRVTGATRADEIDQLVEMVQKTGIPSDWGILARTNKILADIEQGVATRIPVTRKGNKSFWDLKCPALLLGLARSLWFDDMVGIDTILRLADVPEKRLSEIHRQVQSHTKGALSTYLRSGAPGSASEAETLFRQRAKEWRELMRSGSAMLATNGMVHYMTQHLKLIEPGVRNRDEALQRNRELLQAAGAAIGNARGSLGHRLNNLTREQDTKADEAESNAARLLTFHGSKGLEFRNVWMFGCEEGVIPAKGGDVAEERRLFYVGMTRAKQLLVMSHTAAPSPFITECGPLD